MIKNITIFILIAVTVTSFFMFTEPLYQETKMLKAQVASYNEALDNSKALESERDKLTAKYNAISSENLEKIKKLLPDNIDNIRLILEIEKIALPYGMMLRDVNYSTVQSETVAEEGSVRGGSSAASRESGEYGSWDLEFSVSSNYNNFINFTKDLENNLRIVDIASIDFAADPGEKMNAGPEMYRFDFKIKTYWLKN